MTQLVYLDGGTLNKIGFDKERGVVYKQFEQGNGIEKSTARRLVSEWLSMKMMDFAPTAKGICPAGLVMSFMDGEKQLDQAVESYPESVSAGIYRQAGETLANIHGVIRQDASGYHTRHQLKCADLVLKATPLLQRKHIDPVGLYDSLRSTYHRQEIERVGQVWTHGDFWLNNFIGKRVNGSFHMEGVIDWELAGLGSPYEDFAVVKMSIEDQHEGSGGHFWQGYGHQPLPDLQRHFAIVKTLEWMIADDEGKQTNFETPFYEPKINMIRESL